jgi:SEC-C motif
VAVIADDTSTELLAHDELERLAGNADYRPSADEAWGLWALRLTAGDASLPVSFDGDFKLLESILTLRGEGQALRGVKAHAPTRNQPCPCGSGRKFKHCCGG